ncbi:unnamed protein product [Parascedosporium putredinis]|uniref:lytic cellulose monooxygenase (C4-dehydrogenating) n=1 Tax=Parascedosporium putredinis TaxID=1442378 RepID=A0A9P1H9D1_9PEZI|nr:unnamed protein product [Parascedosporium putredinis]CAI8001776.1 unnamed protein product [Parascedosporium putredinis]
MKFSAVLALGYASLASCHTIFQKVSVNGQDKGQLVGLRAPDQDYPTQDVNNPDMTCGKVALTSREVISVAAGDKVGAWWGHVLGGEQWPNDPDHPIARSHHGPITAWLAKVDDAANAQIGQNLQFFKVAEDAFDVGSKTGSFTPAQTQSFPGAYQQNDPSIQTNIWGAIPDVADNQGKPYQAPEMRFRRGITLARPHCLCPACIIIGVGRYLKTPRKTNPVELAQLERAKWTRWPRNVHPHPLSRPAASLSAIMAAATATSSSKIYDFLILVDATASMGGFLGALNSSLPEIIRISALTDCFARIGVVAYRDYCDGPKLLEWSGCVTQAELLEFVAGLRPIGGGDYPEAAKTGLAMAHQVMRADATTIMIVYADAPAHFPHSGGSDRLKEIKALTAHSYGGHGKKFADWVSAARTLAGKDGGKRARVHTILSPTMPVATITFSYLSLATGGLCIGLPNQRKETISEVTIGILLAWMGIPSSGTSVIGKFVKNAWPKPQQLAGSALSADNFATSADEMDVAELAQAVARRKGVDAADFSKRYAADPDYARFVTGQLRGIITENVTAMTVNPVFGTLWRTVCNDRKNPMRDELIQLFGSEVEKLSAAADEKQRMKTWLEESYNYVQDIENAVAAVPDEDQFPCVYLDPTQDFSALGSDEDADADAEEAKPINQFTRNELLEIGRSCDYKILRRLGKVLTRLSYAEKAEDLPQHIREAGTDKVPRMPLALASKDHERQFWTMLLHTVLPGTMLGRRPAALLAALALRMGMRALLDAADEELRGYRPYWNTIEIPETWNLGCLGLLLDADDNFAQRGAVQDAGGLQDARAQPQDHAHRHGRLEPRQGQGRHGPRGRVPPVRVPRSVTIMSHNGVCGLCSAETDWCDCSACQSSQEHDARLIHGVTRADTAATAATWVECGVTTCRAQYIVYNPQALNVRAKCFYCRHSSAVAAKDALLPKARRKGVEEPPLVECTGCLNRMIYPKEYRPKGFDEAAWRCPHCEGGAVTTVVKAETTAQKLADENGADWLLVNKDGALREPFNGRTLLRGVALRLGEAGGQVKEALRGWILRRRAEGAQCSLCFSTVGRSAIHPACGRRGCGQQICGPCRKAWYGINGQGRIINVAALSCPFCRRLPAPTAVSAFGLTRLGHARDAVRHAGSWIYAWCRDYSAAGAGGGAGVRAHGKAAGRGGGSGAGGGATVAGGSAGAEAVSGVRGHDGEDGRVRSY